MPTSIYGTGPVGPRAVNGYAQMTGIPGQQAGGALGDALNRYLSMNGNGATTEAQLPAAGNPVISQAAGPIGGRLGGPAQMNSTIQSGAVGNQTGATMPQYGGTPSPGNNTTGQAGQGPGRWINMNGKQTWLPYDAGDTPGAGAQDSANNTGGVKTPLSGSAMTPTGAATGGYGGVAPTPTNTTGGGGGGTPSSAINPSLYSLPNAQQLQQNLNSQLTGIQGQTSPTAAGATMSPFVAAQAASLPPAQQAALAQAALAQKAGNVSIGAGQAGAVNIGAASQAGDDADMKARQSALADQLNQYATGQKSASALMLQNSNQQNLQQQLALAAAGGTPMAQRMAAQNMGSIGAGLANQQAIAGIQEQEAAASQLNSLLGTARGQTLGLNTFNSGQQNQQAQAQGQISANIGIANANNSTSANIAQGQTNAQVGMFNSGQANALNQFNAGQQNSLNQFNTGQANQQAFNAANLGQQNNQFNAGAQNLYGYNQAQMGQQNNQYNASNQLQFMNQQNQAQYQNMLAQLQLAQQQQYGGIANANNQNAYNIAMANNQSAWDIANLNHVGPGTMAAGGAASALPWLANLLKQSQTGGGGSTPYNDPNMWMP